MPFAFAAPSASLVRLLIRLRSRSAKAAKKVQHERVGVDAELGDNERDFVFHQAGDEMNVAAQAI